VSRTAGPRSNRERFTGQRLLGDGRVVANGDGELEARDVNADDHRRTYVRIGSGSPQANNLSAMTYTTAQGRQQLLDTVAQAIEDLGLALAALGEAYEQLDERSAETLEEELFRPVQAAYGRAQRTYTEFAARHELPTRTFAPASPGHPSQGVKGFLESAVDAAGRADGELATLQDSMLPIEVGDPELRAGLEQVRTLIGTVRGRARELVRRFGR
jgi:hypothetical protein